MLAKLLFYFLKQGGWPYFGNFPVQKIEEYIKELDDMCF